MPHPQSRRPFSPKPNTLGILAASLFTLGLTLSPAAQATDGVAEINETCAVQTGCFPGDTPGYPITIDGQGGRSYRLTSDLIVPNASTDGIQVDTSDVGIDLNNFSIIRSGCEGATTDCTPTSGSGSGIARTSSNIRGTSVKNGSITGMGQGVIIGDQSEVTGLRVRWNRLDGINVGSGSTVVGNTAYNNGGFSGIVASNGSTVAGNTAYNNNGNGIQAAFGATVSGNTAYNNNGDGITTAGGCNVQNNTVRGNDGYGLNLGTDSAFQGNVVTNNTTGTVTGDGSSRGTNYCSGTGTASVFCP